MIPFHFRIFFFLPVFSSTHRLLFPTTLRDLLDGRKEFASHFLPASQKLPPLPHKPHLLVSFFLVYQGPPMRSLCPPRSLPFYRYPEIGIEFEFRMGLAGPELAPFCRKTAAFPCILSILDLRATLEDFQSLFCFPRTAQSNLSLGLPAIDCFFQLFFHLSRFPYLTGTGVSSQSPHVELPHPCCGRTDARRLALCRESRKVRSVQPMLVLLILRKYSSLRRTFRELVETSIPILMYLILFSLSHSVLHTP